MGWDLSLTCFFGRIRYRLSFPRDNIGEVGLLFFNMNVKLIISFKAPNVLILIYEEKLVCYMMINVKYSAKGSLLSSGNVPPIVPIKPNIFFREGHFLISKGF